jgi:hypothetical protein
MFGVGWGEFELLAEGLQLSVVLVFEGQRHLISVAETVLGEMGRFGRVAQNSDDERVGHAAHGPDGLLLLVHVVLVVHFRPYFQQVHPHQSIKVIRSDHRHAYQFLNALR